MYTKKNWGNKPFKIILNSVKIKSDCMDHIKKISDFIFRVTETIWVDLRRLAPKSFTREIKRGETHCIYCEFKVQCDPPTNSKTTFDMQSLFLHCHA